MTLIGEVLTPGHAGYEQSARTMFAAGTPDLVVRPREVDEVVAALRHATSDGLTVSVRSGGHSMAGLSTHSDGVVIDLARMNAVTVLDERLVRVGGGATWGAVAAALQQHGLALTAGDTNDVGVGGLTLGGGIGWMVRRYGLAIDSLVGADIVTADGRLLRADADQHADLFWALRGGGGNFGVVVSFDFAAHPVTTVHFGAIGYEPNELPRLVRGWRDAMRTSDERLTTTLVLMPPMMGRPAAVTLLACFADSDGEAAAAALAPLRRLGTLTSDAVRPMPYAEVLEDAQQLPPGLRLEVRNTLVPHVSDEMIDAVAAEASRTAHTLRSLGGAMGRVPRDATAFAHRDAEVMLLAGMAIPPGADAEEVLARWTPLAAFGSGAYANFLSSASEADVATAFPPDTYHRLAVAKRAYDPRNVFRRNYNIRPA
ncbi:MAG TPA: FAD-binding protein [Jatrophihabitans sp.]|nr:FAD-binding protein [Jatrophihabitans sp.]